ncbi:phosphate ABC transporter substrate-binding protein [Candidatus Soleaferrea massiliensis]|uniref:phosphate ABC transporter substrate-binding protein n=1 Tax=Candidatus Soleaferrea massiliensis TaxID=1470354 RepID=UPI00058F6EDD|nr:phosphate ABC transporter substrate-binding protein [Candidatus Soleaferrea massiliensis]
MKKLLSILMCACMLPLALTGCSNDGAGTGSGLSSQASSAASSQGNEALSGTIKLSGSTSMEKLAKALGEDFTAKNGGVTVDVQLGGSSAAITNVGDGVSDIGNLSRDLKEKEKAMGFNEYKVALDGIGVIVNPNNKVEDLTLDQIAKVFTGEITNWSEVGGDDAEIVVVGREAGSGTRDGFESIVGVGEKCKYRQELNETGQVQNAVASTPGAIGYVSTDYINETVKALKVEGVSPSGDTIKDGSYKLQRNFIMITKGEEKAQVKAFLDYILSDEGQAVVEQVGCFSVK